MRIGFDAFPLNNQYGGVGTYVRGLLSALATQRAPEVELVAYIDSEMTLPPALHEIAKCSSVRFQQVGRWDFRFRGFRDRLDLFHGTNFKTQTQGRCGAILTIHDLWLDRNPQFSKKLFGQHLSFIRTRRRVKNASHVIAVSEFTAREIQEFYGISSDKVTVIHHGVGDNFFPDRDVSRFFELRNRFSLPSNPYILFVGGAGPRKNHKSVFRAFARDPYLKENFSLLVVGSPSYGQTNIWDSVQACGIQSHLFAINSISEDDLRMLYSHAALFVFPSNYEGFGLPVLEAMACGVPVVTSNQSALPEVAGEAALLVDPENEEELAHAMKQVLINSDLHSSLKEKGLVRVGDFTWEQAAQKTLDLYANIIGK